MKKIKTILALSLSILMTVAFLSACGGGGGSSAPPAAEATTAAQVAETEAAPEAPAEAAPADGEVYKLTFTIHQPQTTSFCKAIDEWAAALKEESGGRLIIDVAYGGTLAAANEAVEVCQQDGVDMAWNTVSLNASKFKYCNIMSMYGKQLTNPVLSTHVYYNMVMNNEAFAKEFDDLGLVCVSAWAMTPSLLAGSGDKIVSLDQFSGKSIQAISKTCISVLESYGAAVVGVTPADLYENLSKNVVSGSLIDSSLYIDNKLYEQMDWMNTTNYNTALAFTVINKDKFNSLPADLQDLMMSKSEEFSFACAKYLSEGFASFVDEVAPANNVEIYDSDPDVEEKLYSEYDSLIKQPWEEACNEAGYDTEAITSQIEDLCEEAASLYSEYNWFDK